MTDDHLKAVYAHVKANLPDNDVFIEWPGCVVVYDKLHHSSWWFGDANGNWGGSRYDADDDVVEVFETRYLPELDDALLIAAELVCRATRADVPKKSAV